MTQTTFPDDVDFALEPLLFAELCWPDIIFYPEQIEIIESVRDDDETYVKAGNALGKDFVAGFIALWWFCSRRPARVVTTSVKIEQLEDVLWGEIRRLINASKVKLPILAQHLKIRALNNDGTVYPNAELVGQVSNTQEGLLGRHSTDGFAAVQNDIARTLVMFDEASGINDSTYTSTQTWAHHKLIFGNPFPCENFFKRGCLAGNLPRPGSIGGYYRRVLKITAWDSPNVKLAQEEIKRGLEPSNTIIIPGVKSWNELQKNLLLWDPILQTVGLKAEFYEGPEQKLYPPEWLTRAASIYTLLRKRQRRAKAIGIDPAEGGDKTSMCVIDEYGIIELISVKTPDTADIIDSLIALGRKHSVSDEYWMFDRGGGGKQHADRLRRMGYKNVRTVGFGEVIQQELKRGMVQYTEKVETREDKYTYMNKRAEMYGEMRHKLDPTAPGFGFAIPGPECGQVYEELRKQMKPIPLSWNEEGRMFVLPKNSKTQDKNEMTLTKLIGHSPDELDSLVIANYCMTHKPSKTRAGVA